MAWYMPLTNINKDDLTDDFLPLEEEIQRAYVDGYPSKTLELTAQDLERLGKYLRKMLVVDPQQRATGIVLAGDTSWTSVDGTSDGSDGHIK